MTNILLIVLGVLIGIIIQAILDIKGMTDLEKEVDTLEDNYNRWLDDVKKALEAADGNE